MQRLVHWSGIDDWRAEAAEVELGEHGVSARGVQLGADPLPYRLDYELDATDGWATRRLEVEAAGEGWSRSLVLKRGPDGWSVAGDGTGEVDLEAAGGPAEGLAEALDCDLGFSPLTNLMPVRRGGLHEGRGPTGHLMAWVAVPSLEVFPSAQRYEPVSASGDGSLVRYADRGRFEGFRAELRLDRDGLVVEYPGLARRVAPAQ